MIAIINFIRSLSKEDYDRFINFLHESRNCPYFSTLYDQDDFHKDMEYFKELFCRNFGGK